MPQFENYGKPNPSLKVRITVDEVFDNHHSVVKQWGSTSGRFTFTAAEAGEHRLCVTPSRAVPGGAHIGGEHSRTTLGTVRLTLDLIVGETNKIERTDKGKMQDMVQRVQDLKSRLEDIRKEQVFQRVSRQLANAYLLNLKPHFPTPWSAYFTNRLQEREAEFRDQSELTNSRVVRWTIIQLVVLGGTCAWQLSHLRAFFIKQKLT